MILLYYIWCFALGFTVGRYVPGWWRVPAMILTLIAVAIVGSRL